MMNVITFIDYKNEERQKVEFSIYPAISLGMMLLNIVTITFNQTFLNLFQLIQILFILILIGLTCLNQFYKDKYKEFCYALHMILLILSLCIYFASTELGILYFSLLLLSFCFVSKQQKLLVGIAVLGMIDIFCLYHYFFGFNNGIIVILYVIGALNIFYIRGIKSLGKLKKYKDEKILKDLSKVGYVGAHCTAVFTSMVILSHILSLEIFLYLLVFLLTFAIHKFIPGKMAGIGLDLISYVMVFYLIGYFGTNNVANYFVFISSFILLLIGKKRFPSFIGNGEVDYYWVIGFISLVTLFTMSNTWLIVALLSMSAFSFMLYKRNYRLLDVISIVGALFFVYAAIILQKIVTLPNDYTFPVYITLFYLFALLALQILGEIKNKKLHFYISLIFTSLLILNTLTENNITRGLYTAICLAFLILYACYTKNKRQAICSIVELVVLVVIFTQSFWMSIAWWVYLLSVGVILISIAIYQETKKK
ncbi:MAG: hypothetical protein ACK5L6_11065 [Anaerorhabdus sp.]|uniref:hypothetical protein n=1 Tax=Anaerorhabdus sp. TaxID=1872524 RepID=UPI003A88EF5D